MEEKAKNILKSYMLYKKTYDSIYYAKRVMRDIKINENLMSDAVIKMKAIKDLVEKLPNSDVKLLITYHYIYGMTIKRCAECLRISNRSLYRKLNRGHLAFANLIEREGGNLCGMMWDKP